MIIGLCRHRVLGSESVSLYAFKGNAPRDAEQLSIGFHLTSKASSNRDYGKKKLDSH